MAIATFYKNQEKLMFPILLLVASLASIFIYLRTDNDIFALLAVGMSIICLIWGLVIAHWSIHVLALFAVLYLGKPVAVATVDSRRR
ncbi:MAG: hypothetical protein AAF652_12720 [Cyanobacteria bacterium P01_C01_bin.72]